MKDKKSTIDLLKDLTNLNIKDFEFEDLKKMDDYSGYDFETIKLRILINNENNAEKEFPDIIGKDIYIKLIRKDRIKESIFCYWSLLYDDMFKNYEESEFTTVINKVRITETESEEYKHTVLLQIKENKWGILEYGSTIHLVKFQKYLNDNAIKKSDFKKEWKRYIDKENQDVLFIGIVN